MGGSLALRPRVEESPPPGERIGLHLDELALPLVVSCMARGVMLDFFFAGGLNAPFTLGTPCSPGDRTSSPLGDLRPLPRRWRRGSHVGDVRPLSWRKRRDTHPGICMPLAPSGQVSRQALSALRHRTNASATRPQDRRRVRGRANALARPLSVAGAVTKSSSSARAGV
jgi:hypothetical protein